MNLQHKEYILLVLFSFFFPGFLPFIKLTDNKQNTLHEIETCNVWESMNILGVGVTILWRQLNTIATSPTFAHKYEL